MSSFVRIMASVPRDLRLGLRLFAKQPGFTALALLILALGIGANTAVFGITNALLLKPRPGVGEQLVGVYSKDRTQPDSFRAFSYQEYTDLRDHKELFASLVAHNFALVGLTNGDTTRRAFVDIVAGDFFGTFGVPLARGRSFTTAEEKPGADVPVAVVSYSLWQRLGHHEDLLGRTLRVNQREFTVVGVAPQGFGGSTVLFAPEMWVPTGVYDTLANDFVKEGQNLADRRHRSLILVARLQPQVTVASAGPMLLGIAGQMERAYPSESRNQDLIAAPLSRLSVSTSPQKDTALVSMATALSVMSSIVLLIASLNLANMLLARGGARRKEFAIRLALGGSRGRVVRQLLAENVLLSLAGGAGGLLLGWWSLRLLASSLIPAMPIWIDFDATPDARVFLATFGFCLLSTLFFGLGPAWKLARTDALPELKGHAGELAGARRSRLGLAGRDLLVMGQLALSLVLLTAAGLFVRGAVMAAKADPGFSFDRGIVANIDSSLAGYDDARGRQLYHDALAAIRQQPGVQAASIATLMPFGEFHITHAVQLPGAPVKPADPDARKKLIEATYTSITGDYFQSLGLAVRRGREFSPAEEFATDGPRIAIIDDSLARDLFADADPVGQQVQIAAATAGAPPVVYDVVGIAPPIRHQLFDEKPGPHFYVPIGRDFTSNAYLHVKTHAASSDSEAAMLPAVRRALIGVDARLPILMLETRPMYRDRSVFLAILNAGAGVFTTFGVVALIMAALGVYGVKAYVVSRRTREIGIRVALGASARNVVWMIVREGLTLSAIGLGIGMALSIVAGIGLQQMLYQGGGQNGMVIGAAFVALAGSALAASWLPARRATRIAPIRTLRSE
jgi:predicted permease